MLIPKMYWPSMVRAVPPPPCRQQLPLIKSRPWPAVAPFKKKQQPLFPSTAAVTTIHPSPSPSPALPLDYHCGRATSINFISVFCFTIKCFRSLRIGANLIANNISSYERVREIVNTYFLSIAFAWRTARCKRARHRECQRRRSTGMLSSIA